MCGAGSLYHAPGTTEGDAYFRHIQLVQHTFIADFFMAGTEDKAMDKVFSNPCLALAPTVPSWAELHPSPFCICPMNFRSSLSLAFQQLLQAASLPSSTPIHHTSIKLAACPSSLSVLSALWLMYIMFYSHKMLLHFFSMS